MEPHAERRLAELAERQHGVVTTAQLRALGLGRSGVSRRASAGRLHHVHRGVYAVGRRRLSKEGVLMAAVLACGPGAVLSHRSAAGLLGLRRDERPRVDVTRPVASARRRPGIDVHVSSTLTRADITTVDGIPCTTVARTHVDLGDVSNRRAVERAVDQAVVLGVFDLREVEAALERAGPRRGAGLLRAVLADWEQPALTDRELEERFLALCRTASLPSPAVNAWVTAAGGVAYKADFLWRRESLIAECDSREFHSHASAFEHDRLRDRRLSVAGFTVVRFTWRQLAREPEAIVDALRSLLARLARP